MVSVSPTDWRGHDFTYRAELERTDADTKVRVRHEGGSFVVPASRILWVEGDGRRLDSNSVSRSRAARLCSIVLTGAALGSAGVYVVWGLGSDDEDTAAGAAGAAIKIGLVVVILVIIAVWNRVTRDAPRP